MPTLPTRPERGGRVFPVVVLVAAVVLGLVTFAYRYISFVDFSNDHFVHLSMAQQVTMGAWPVRDFVERGLPLMSLVSAAAQVALGPGLGSELALVSAGFALAAAATLLCLFAVSRSLTIAIGLAAATVLVFPVSYSYPKLLLYAVALGLGVVYAARATWPWAAALGAAVGVAFLFRHDHGVIIGAGLPVLVLAREGPTGRAVRAILASVAAGVIVVAPYGLWVQHYEGIATYVEDGVLFSAREAERGTWGELPGFAIDRAKPMFSRLVEGPIVNVRWRTGAGEGEIRQGEQRHELTRRDPVGPLTWQYELHAWSRGALERLVGDPLVADTNGIDRRAFRLQEPPPVLDQWLVRALGPAAGLAPRQNGLALIFDLVWVAPAAALALLMGTWRRAPASLRAPVLMAITLQLLMDLTMLRDPLDTRVRDVVVPAFMLLAFVFGAAWSLRTHLLVVGLVRVATCALVGVVMVACGSLGDASLVLERIDVKHGGPGVSRRLRQLHNQLAPPRARRGRLSPAYESLAAYIESCTSPASRVLALTFAPELFFYSGRGFAGGQVTLTPGYFATPRHADLMLERLAHEDVPLVIMDSDTRQEFFAIYPRVAGRVRDRYDEVWKVPVAAGKDWIVLAERGRAIARRYAAERLPCFVKAGA